MLILCYVLKLLNFTSIGFVFERLKRDLSIEKCINNKKFDKQHWAFILILKKMKILCIYCDKAIVELEYLDTMIFTITNEDISIGHNGNAFESFELSIATAPRTKRSQETSIRMENLNAVISRISYAYITLVIYCNSSAKIEFQIKLIKAFK